MKELVGFYRTREKAEELAKLIKTEPLKYPYGRVRITQEGVLYSVWLYY